MPNYEGNTIDSRNRIAEMSKSKGLGFRISMKRFRGSEESFVHTECGWNLEPIACVGSEVDPLTTVK